LYEKFRTFCHILYEFTYPEPEPGLKTWTPALAPPKSGRSTGSGSATLTEGEPKKILIIFYLSAFFLLKQFFCFKLGARVGIIYAAAEGFSLKSIPLSGVLLVSDQHSKRNLVEYRYLLCGGSCGGVCDGSLSEHGEHVSNAAIRDPDLRPVHDPVLSILAQIRPSLQSK
jgi:hypothetical protein